MPRFLDTRDDVDYTGMDIVPEIINTHKKKFSKKPFRFSVSCLHGSQKSKYLWLHESLSSGNILEIYLEVLLKVVWKIKN